MDSACDLIDFCDDVDVVMPMEDIKVSPTCCSKYKDGLSLNNLDPDAMVVDTQGPILTSPELLCSLHNITLEVPAELAPPARPIRKVIHKATKAQGGGRRVVEAPGIDSRPSCEYFISLRTF